MSSPLSIPRRAERNNDGDAETLSNPIEQTLAACRGYSTEVSDVHIRLNDVPWITTLRQTIRFPGATAITRDHIEDFFRSRFPEPLQKECRNVLERGYATTAIHKGPFAPVRIHAYHEINEDSNALGFSIRLLSATVPKLSTLHLPETIANFVDYDSGLVLFCGATNSGKSTATAALIAAVNEKRACRIITIEDPIEYRHRPNKASIVQQAVGDHIPSYFEGFRSALRSAPNIIFIGEMRDPETMRQAIIAAQSGHLVISTIHANGAADTIERILGSFDAKEADAMRTYFAYVMRAIVALRLLPRQDGTGLVPATEILLHTEAVREHIRKQTTNQIYNEMHAGRASGMHTLEDDLSSLVKTGAVTLEEAKRVANKPDEVR